MGNIIDGKVLSQTVKDEVKAEVLELEAKYGRKPCLVVIIVGENPASQVYVRNKVNAAAYTGMDSRLVELPADISEEALLGQIRALNEDPLVDGSFRRWMAGDTYLAYPGGVPSFRFLELRNGIITAEKIRILNEQGLFKDEFAALAARFDREAAMDGKVDFAKLKDAVLKFVNR